jgi:transposase
VGRSRGGLTTKLHAACADESHAVAFVLTAGQRHDSVAFGDLLDSVPEPEKFDRGVADQAYDSDDNRARLSEAGLVPVIPGRSNRLVAVAYDEVVYKERNRVERLIGKLKQFRRIATRYEKLSCTFMALVHLAAAFIAIR